MDQSEYASFKLSVIPKEINVEYNLLDYEHNGWIYFNILRGCYGLPWSGRLSNDLLLKWLNKEDYFQASTTPELWRHKWWPIQFTLIVDEFGMKYVGRKHAKHLDSVLKNYDEMSEDREGKKIVGIELIWDYTQKHSGRTCRLSMKSYIENSYSRWDINRQSRNSFPHTVLGRSRMEASLNKHQQKINHLPYMK